MTEELLIREKATLKQTNLDFYNYINNLGLRKKSRTLILSAVSFFYYEPSEVYKFKDVVCLKNLNSIEKLDSFITSISVSLKIGTNFYGCFINNKFGQKSFKYFSFFEFITLLIDTKMKRLMSQKDVSILLAANNFKILDMKEINGIIYFYSKKL
jgi:hypothetical protein